MGKQRHRRVGAGSVGLVEGIGVAPRARSKPSQQQQAGHFPPIELQLTVTISKREVFPFT